MVTRNLPAWVDITAWGCHTMGLPKPWWSLVVELMKWRQERNYQWLHQSTTPLEALLLEFPSAVCAVLSLNEKDELDGGIHYDLCFSPGSEHAEPASQRARQARQARLRSSRSSPGPHVARVFPIVIVVPSGWARWGCAIKCLKTAVRGHIFYSILYTTLQITDCKPDCIRISATRRPTEGEGKNLTESLTDSGSAANPDGVPLCLSASRCTCVVP